MTEDECRGAAIDALQADVEELQAETEGLGVLLADLDANYAIVRGAEAAWQAFIQARTEFVFRNGAGDLAHMPVKLAHLIATKGTLDCAVVAKNASILFTRGDTTLAEIPKSLFVVLDTVLAEWPWIKGKAPSLSRDSR